MALIERLNQARWALELARVEEGQRITEALQLGRVVGVLGEGEVGKTLTIREALGVSQPGHPIIRLDLEGVASEAHLAFRLARQLLAAELGLEFSTLKVGVLVPASLERKRVELAELYGLDTVEEALRDWPSGELRLTRALAALTGLARRRETVLWIDHLEAPGLTPRHPLDLDRFLWAVRETAQTQPGLNLVLSGRSAVDGRVLGPEAAFHQQGRWLSLDNPPRAAWQQVASRLQAPRDLAADLEVLTNGHPETMLAALATASRDKRESAEELLLGLASASADLQGRAVQHGCSLHRLSGQVLEQIARGEGPYAASQRGKTSHQEISKVLGKLRLAGLIRRDEGWSVVNPLVGILLRRDVPWNSAPD
jgi:hypothetical protein